MSDEKRMTPERLAEWRRIVVAYPFGVVPTEALGELLAELDAVTREREDARKHAEERGNMLFDEQMARHRAERERDEARKDTARLDWWDRRMHDGPSVGFYTDGRLGIGRGHLVDSKWTVKARPYLTLRDAIDAASDPAASIEGGKAEAPCPWSGKPVLECEGHDHA